MNESVSITVASNQGGENVITVENRVLNGDLREVRAIISLIDKEGAISSNTIQCSAKNARYLTEALLILFARGGLDGMLGDPSLGGL
jgi:hypothetical protein